MNKGYSEILYLIEEAWQSGRFKELAVQWSENQNIVTDIWTLNEHNNQKVAWRSAYLLDLIHDCNPSILESYLTKLGQRVQLVDNNSVKRHYLRILSQHDISEKVDGHFVDACFKWLSTESTPIAVKANCMVILFKLCTPYPELASELKDTLINLLPYASKGEANKAKKILKRIDGTIQG